LLLRLRFVFGRLLRLRTILTLSLWTFGVRASGVTLALLGLLSRGLLLLPLSRRALIVLLLPLLDLDLPLLLLFTCLLLAFLLQALLRAIFLRRLLDSPCDLVSLRLIGACGVNRAR
jgi:hypothetical protein